MYFPVHYFHIAPTYMMLIFYLQINQLRYVGFLRHNRLGAVPFKGSLPQRTATAGTAILASDFSYIRTPTWIVVATSM